MSYYSFFSLHHTKEISSLKVSCLDGDAKEANDLFYFTFDRIKTPNGLRSIYFIVCEKSVLELLPEIFTVLA